jgi:hypothetical protein
MRRLLQYGGYAVALGTWQYIHYGSYRYFRRPEAAKNKPIAVENKLFLTAMSLFSAVSGRQKNRPKIRLYFRRPEPGRRKQLIFGGWLSGRRK